MEKTEMNKLGALIILSYFIFFMVSCANTESTDTIAGEKIVEVENGYIPAEKAKVKNVKDYVQWIQDPDNGFKKEKTINNLTFSAQFKPYEYIVCLEEKKDILPDSLVRRKVGELKDMQYYDLKISLKEFAGELLKYQLTSSQQYTERVNYFAFGMQHDIHLVEGTDTLACELYHFERTFDAAPTSTILLGFHISNQKTAENKTLLFYDRTFNTGLIKFTFRTQELKNLPKLKTS
ncbi:MAG TPA: hypothetical protein PLR01_05870 [Bacteroidales bacterium]|nr:hypothetical protein [Saprospiraceae bacterium]HPI85880.1 hypothetical protein [Bacteroidales bacterium]